MNNEEYFNMLHDNINSEEMDNALYNTVNHSSTTTNNRLTEDKSIVRRISSIFKKKNK
jgi:hypothetical protein